MKIVIATIKSWNINRAKLYKQDVCDKHDVWIISEPSELTTEKLITIDPDIIFFPHWSSYISPEIFDGWKCIVFHMTDLPYGRGGSPLQNLIVNGKENTVISALKVCEKFDAGPIYMKTPLSLEGSAQEIFERASEIIFGEMIPIIIENDPIPIEQDGEVVIFKRRTPMESEIFENVDIASFYNHIRMLDAEGYPHAFLKYGDYILEFSDAKMHNDCIDAKVHIYKE